MSNSYEGLDVETTFSADGTGRGTMKGTGTELLFTFSWRLDGDMLHYMFLTETSKGVTKDESHKPEGPPFRLKWISNDRFEQESVNYEPYSKSTFTRKKS